jgi:hypothetical protein
VRDLIGTVRTEPDADIGGLISLQPPSDQMRAAARRTLHPCAQAPQTQRRTAEDRYEFRGRATSACQCKADAEAGDADGQKEVSMTVKCLSAGLALPFGLFLGLSEIVRNWGDWGPWPFWVVDYLAVILLISAWFAHRRGTQNGRALLAGAWGFTCAMFYLSFFSHLTLTGSAGGPLNSTLLTVAVGVLFAVSAVGFVLSLV